MHCRNLCKMDSETGNINLMEPCHHCKLKMAPRTGPIRLKPHTTAPPRTRTPYHFIVPILLQFLLTFAQGPGHGVAAQPTGFSPSVGDRVSFTVREESDIGTLVGTIPVKNGYQYKFSEEPAEFALNPSTGKITTRTVIDRDSLESDVFNLFILSTPSALHLIEVRITVLDINDNNPIFTQPSVSLMFAESYQNDKTNQPATSVILDTATDQDIGDNDIQSYHIVSGNEDNKFRLVALFNTSTPVLYLMNNQPLDREDKGFYQLKLSAKDGGDPVREGFLLVNITIKDVNDNSPRFDQSEYFAMLNETAPGETKVIQIRATDEDIGYNGDITYSITNDDFQQFEIKPKTGIIFTRKPLNCKAACPFSLATCEPNTCVVLVEAKDSGRPVPKTDSAFVYVTLIDENDHDPVIRFSYNPRNSPYAQVNEGATNLNIAFVSITDADEGLNGETTVRIIQGNEREHFQLQGPFLRVVGVLDRERVSKYNLTFEATDKGSPPRSSTKSLIIMVNDVNDHSPEFEYESYAVELSELAPLGSFVAAITATDNDTGINAQLTYTITDGNSLGWFHIDPTTGLVTTAKQLDRETSSSLDLTIQAKDGNPEPRRTDTSLSVVVWDENDEAPVFTSQSYSATFREGTKAGTEVITVSASDSDEGLNGTVRYSLSADTEQQYENMFEINAISGKIDFLREVDREEFQDFHLTVIASDRGQPSLQSTSIVQINLTDINDNSPVFYPIQYFATVEENTVSRQIVQVLATDLDAGDNAVIDYSITDGNQLRRFTIDVRSGWISNRDPLNKRDGAKYILKVAARDQGGRQSLQTATVEVSVIDAQDVPPQFGEEDGYSFSVTEDNGLNELELNRYVGQVSASASTTPSYKIIAGDEFNRFTINQNTGVLRTSAIIDREEDDFYSLSIIATSGNLFTQTVANITIRDVNDNIPTFPSERVKAVLVEDWPVGHEVYLAQAVDFDSGSNGETEYTLSEPSSMFTIDSASGLISLSKTAVQSPATTFQLTVTATDTSNSAFSDTMNVVITLSDVNDHTPVFEQSSYEVSIPEDTAVNDRFFRVTATDADSGLNAAVTYKIVKGNSAGLFGAFPDGVLYVAKQLDRESRQLFVLTIMAVDGGKEPRNSLVNMTVHVLDSNDNSPRFSNDTYDMSLTENSPPGSYVGTVYAMDLDSGQNAELFFQLAHDEDGFRIHPKTGVITSTMEYDRETLKAETDKDYIGLEVLVQDSGSPQRESSAIVRVHIRDVNDNTPVFNLDVYESSIFENVEVDSPVIRVTASDDDAGDNSLLHYAIIKGNTGNKFSMDEENGQISLLNALDRETDADYTLVVMAMDSGIPPRNATVEVRLDILDTNDNAPVFVTIEDDYEISETADVGAIITQVSAIDDDLGNNARVTYNIARGNIGSAFNMDSTTGRLTVASSLDYEQHMAFELNITAQDYGNPRLTSSIIVTVKVVDVNDNAPHFPATTIVRQIKEGVDIATSVTTVRATDPDDGNNGQLKYSIKSQQPPGEHFVIDADSGVLSTNGDIDHEYADNFKLMIVATDQTQPVTSRQSSEKLVTVIIEDINDNAPKFVSVDAVQILFGTEPNTPFATVRAHDPDSGVNGQVFYDITSGDISIFGIRSNTGELYLKSSLNNQVLFYHLTLRARDQAMINDPSSDLEATFFPITIFVRSSVESGPAFTQSSYSGQVYENEPAETSVVTVSTTGANSDLEYFITDITSQGEVKPRYFEIHPTTGVIQTTQSLDRELGAELFDVEVYAVNTGSPTPETRTVKVQITLLDKNDSPPRFIPPNLTTVVAENARPGYVVATLTSQDDDLEGVVTYGLQDGGEGKFEVDTASGELKVSSPLDRELKAIYDLEVTAADGVQSSTSKVTVEVTDINDEQPTFTRPWYSFDVREDMQTGVLVGQIVATDGDTGDNAKVTYTLVSHWGREKFSLQPHSGVITLIGKLDYEEHDHFVLTVKAQDSGATSLSTTVSVYVNVIDVNDNAPVFDLSTYSDEVNEDTEVSTAVLAVKATDVDSGSNGQLRYSIVKGNRDDCFGINAETGELSIAKPLDRERQALYELSIEATDQAEKENERFATSAVVTVIVQDANDNAPRFESADQITVMEDSLQGSPVATIVAVDDDEGDNSKVKYSIVSGPGSLFSLGEEDGVLKLNGDLDREDEDRYSLVVVATDNGDSPKSSTMDLVVKVGDVNDNDPIFEQKTYSTDTNENTKVGSNLLTVLASDTDAGLNADIRYMIMEGEESWDFRVDSHTGQVSIFKRLDYERRQSYEVTILAQDLGQPSRTDTATLMITVNDVNDSPPVFVDSPYKAFVQENSTDLPVHVLQLTAKDADSASFSRLTYNIRDGDRDVFNIDRGTGEITALRTLDRETRDQYTLVVMATDSGVPRLTGSGSVTIMVGDVNDNPPVFHHDNYIAMVTENQRPGAAVTQVSAKDADVGKNAEIRYSLAHNGRGSFKINPQTGEITTARKLDREKQEVHHLVVVATDGGSLPISSSASVTVIVEDDNDHVPDFGVATFSPDIRYSTSSGTFIVGATAMDADQGDNGRLTYSLYGGDANKFSVDRSSGVVTAKMALSGSDGSYSFNVRVTDQGESPQSSEAQVQVNFLPSSLTDFPRFMGNRQKFGVSEDAQVGHVVHTVRAVSPDNTVVVSYNVAGGNLDDSFEVDSEGQVKVKRPLDYERTKSYGLWIEAIDDHDPPRASYWRLTVQITDANDNPPLFEEPLYAATVTEGRSPPQAVVMVTALDADTGDNGKVTYELVDGNVGGAFSIGETSGHVQTVRTLDRETLDHYSLVVTARDHGQSPHTATATIDVTVQDVNDQPPSFTEHFRTKIYENWPRGTFVIKITSTDEDVGDNAKVSYSLDSNPGDMFAIDDVSGNITVAGTLDRESTDTYILLVAINDGAYGAQTQVSIDILDANDNAPSFDQTSYNFRFVEGQSGGAVVGEVSANDIDAPGPNSDMYFHLKTSSKLFHLDPESGVLISREVMHYTPKGATSSPINSNIHKLIVQAIDHGEPPLKSEVTVTIQIRPANQNAPQFNNTEYRAYVTENAQVDDSVFQLMASDADFAENADLTYSATAGDASGFLDVQPTGLVKVSSAAFGESGQTYSLQVAARDAGLPVKSATTLLLITVTEVNQYEPKFTGPSQNYRVSIPEDRDVTSVIGQVTATDRDEGQNGRVRYYIGAGDPDGHFSVDDVHGHVRVEKTLDYEVQSSYSLEIVAEDRGFLPRQISKTFTVQLTDVNDNPPVFDQEVYEAFIAENSDTGSPVFKVSANDLDESPNDLVEYYMIGTDSALDKFSLQEDTGLLLSQGDLDYEQVQEYEVLVKAINPGTTFSSSTTISVHVTGVNEYTPRFARSEYLFTISESTKLGSPIGTVSATDQDLGQESDIFYYLVGDSNSKGFSIDTHTGSLTVVNDIDREATAEIILDVLAKNHGPIRGNNTDQCQVRVIVRDANDPPQFTQSVYEVTIPESETNQKNIIRVSAVDNDLEPNFRKFTYRILAGNSEGKFELAAENGWVSSTGPLDRETLDQYELTVGAVETGPSAKTGTTTVRVTLRDVNDNGPVFQPSLPEGHIPENHTPYTTTVLDLRNYATDPDLPPNQGPYQYSLLDHTDIFDLGRTSGLVKSRVMLDREGDSPEYQVKVRVSDNGDPKMSSTLTFKVVVDDVNDNPSEARDVDVIVYAYDGVFTGGKIADVKPLDLDLTGDYQCDIGSGDITTFSIPSSCDLNANQLQDMKQFMLSIQGSDGVHSTVTYDAQVEFRRFDDAAVQATVVVMLDDITVSAFLSMTLDMFASGVNSALGGSNTAIYNVEQVDSNLLVFLAGQQSGNSYLSRNKLAQRLLSHQTNIETQSKVTILAVNYDPCSSTPCHHGGDCSFELAVGPGYIINDSPSYVLTSPNVHQAVTCVCTAGYTGQTCETPINACRENPCLHGATCTTDQSDGSYDCQCLPSWTGDRCETDVNECRVNPNLCKNGGQCINREGSYKCQCVNNYTGTHCEVSGGSCTPNPCNTGQCVPQGGSYSCQCPYGDHGGQCQIQSQAYHTDSYTEYNLVMDEDINSITLEFVVGDTSQPSLLFLYPVTVNTFLAVEVVDRRVQFSFSLGEPAVTTVTSRPIEAGTWYRVEVSRDGKTGVLLVTECPDNDPVCEVCDGSSQCYSQAEADFGILESSSGGKVLIGGAKDFSSLLNTFAGQISAYDFRGCLRNAVVDGVDLSQLTPVDSSATTYQCSQASVQQCARGVCKNGGVCRNDWDDYWCECPASHMGKNCDAEKAGTNFGSDSSVIYRQKVSYQRQKQLATPGGGRKRRAVKEEEVREISVKFRTSQTSGVLFYSEHVQSYTALYVYEDKVWYTMYHSSGSPSAAVTVSAVEVTDGDWHVVKLEITDADSVMLTVDGETEQMGVSDPAPLLDLQTTLMSLGDAVKPVSKNGDAIEGFSGCVEYFKMGDKELPPEGSTERFEIEQSGDISTCALAATGGGSSGVETAVIVIIVFFAIVLIVIGILIVVCIRRRRQKGVPAVKQNGTSHLGNGRLNKSTESHNHQDSGYTEGDPTEEAIIGQHIASELNRQPGREGHSQPDLVVPDTAGGRVIMDPSGVDNVGFSEEPPEHYDIDNTSSIAPSDLLDVVGHYRRYRTGKPLHTDNRGPGVGVPSGGHRHRNPQHTPSPSTVLSRDSPALVSSHPNPNMMAMQSTPLVRQGLNPLSRASPLQPQLRQSPVPNIPARSLRSTPLSGISELYPDSSATYSDATTIPNGHGPKPRKNLQQPISQLGLRSTPVGLTVEEVERLNNRQLSPSTMDGGSTSSDDPSRNNINRTDFTHADLLDPSSMLPPESSSDDSTNDSFTCSEFEYDHEKIRNDVNAGRLFPRLARVDEADDTDLSRHSNVSDTVSNREGSISTFFTSDDELPRGSKVPNTALNWDYLLNWGPNFEKLVGVFSDIAQLPDIEPKFKPTVPPKGPSPRQKTSRQPTPQSPMTQLSRQPTPQSPVTQLSRQPTPQSHVTLTQLSRQPTPQSPVTQLSRQPTPQSPVTQLSRQPTPQSPVTQLSRQPTPQSPMTQLSRQHTPISSYSPHPYTHHPSGPSPVSQNSLSWQPPVAQSPLSHTSRSSTPRSPISEILNTSKEEYV